MNLSKYFSSTNTKDTRLFEGVIQLIIIVSIITFTISTIPTLTDQWKLWLERFEIGIVIVFSLEYLLRIYYSEKKLSYVLSFWGIIDLIAILPFYLSLAFDLRAIRIVRLLRVFRAFKMLKYNKAIERLKLAFLSIREELVMFSILSVMFIYLSAVGIWVSINVATKRRRALNYDLAPL